MDQTALEKELRTAADKTRRNARQNYFAAYIVAIISVASSLAAAIMAALSLQKPALTAILASVPAAGASVWNRGQPAPDLDRSA
jgi:hypothetical protein